jgi:hypothetical protein
MHQVVVLTKDNAIVTLDGFELNAEFVDLVVRHVHGTQGNGDRHRWEEIEKYRAWLAAKNPRVPDDSFLLETESADPV